MTSRPGRRGFTLIEILVVVTIIITVLGFATPTISAFLSNRRLKGVSGQIARALAAARTRAITRHQDVYALFLRDRIMLVPSRPDVPEFFPYHTSAQDADKLTIHLRFAGVRIVGVPMSEAAPLGVESPLPELPERPSGWNEPVAARDMMEGGALQGPQVFLLFRSEGTVEFGSAGGPGDRLPMGFWADPPVEADIVVEQAGSTTYGWIDIRPTGNVDTRLSTGAPMFKTKGTGA